MRIILNNKDLPAGQWDIHVWPMSTFTYYFEMPQLKQEIAQRSRSTGGIDELCYAFLPSNEGNISLLFE